MAELLWATTALGIELGSTRIKAVLIGADGQPLATGSYDWENRLEQGVWTYSLEEIRVGLQTCYRALAAEVQTRFGQSIRRVGAIGISAMMHGYLAFDAAGGQLAQFRTWRNTTTAEAAALLTDALQFNMPQRWSAAHYFQAILNGESHVKAVAFLTTLSGYVHWLLTGEKVLGVGDASGMFPVDSAALEYDAAMLQIFDALAGARLPGAKPLRSLLPKVLCAGEPAGALTEAGALLLDPSGALRAGVPLCPPEGDAGTGMVATNAVAAHTGNVSAGTSIFAMAVLEQPLSRYYTEIDMVTTPSGKPVAMVHCNNCSSDLDAWVRLFGEVCGSFGAAVPKGQLYDTLYRTALAGEKDCGGVLSCNYVSGEPLTGFAQGRPFLLRHPDARFNLPNLMRSLLLSALTTLRLGMDLLTEREGVHLHQLMGHGGLFKTEGVGQQLMAAALEVPVAVMASAGEGGAWGIALLAGFLQYKKTQTATLEDYLAQRIFAQAGGTVAAPEPSDVQGFTAYLERYQAALAVERAAVEHT
ncbi:MAG: ATPase [Oscillospiraceae bacterium]|jgi:sugar (pentulose or hexulose) kinase|nr:ATPase [Oscillospiraceae bacterium]